MKECIICKETKELEEFYVHKQMSDGHINKCKKCCKLQAKVREENLRLNPEWVEKEKERAREKYFRLDYKTKHKPSTESKRKIMSNYINSYPEKRKAKNVSQHLNRKEGHELHHWSYNQQHWKDVIELSIADHNLLHRHLVYDKDLYMYRSLSGVLLETKEDHVNLLKALKLLITIIQSNV